MGTAGNAVHHEPWNKGKIVGQKAPFKLKDIWALRVRLQMEGRVRELALFNLGIRCPRCPSRSTVPLPMSTRPCRGSPATRASSSSSRSRTRSIPSSFRPTSLAAGYRC